MEKSQVKQALLALLFGPAGIIYSSANCALLLTLVTLIGVLVAVEHTLYILPASFLLSVICGWLIVRSHNKIEKVQDFTLSTYIGRVSCKVTGKGTFKRDYSKPLARAKLKRRVRQISTCALATLTMMAVGLITLPRAMQQLDDTNDGNGIKNITVAATDTAAKTTTDNEPEIAAAYKHGQLELSNIGIWQIASDADKNSFQARLQGNSYQNTSEGFYRPTLTLSCVSGNPTLSFDAHEVLGTESTNLKLQFDARTEESYDWSLKSDYRSAYAKVSKPLIRKLTGAANLQINYLPFGTDNYKSINFDLGNTSSITQKLNRQCA